MADRFWRGTAGDNDWGNTNNWSATRFGATGAGVPASNDDVYVLDGPDITAGLAQSAVDLNSLTIAFDGIIGTPSSSLAIAVSGTSGATLLYRGRGAYCNITAGTNGIDVLHVESTGSGVFNLTSGTTVDVRAGARGRLVVAAAAVISTSLKSAGMDIDIHDNATDIPTALFAAGLVTSRRDIDVVTVGPRATYRTTEDVTVDTSIDVYGRWEHRSSGTVALANCYPGSVSTAEGSVAQGFTITALHKYEGAQVFENDPMVTVSAATYYGRAGR